MKIAMIDKDGRIVDYYDNAAVELVDEFAEPYPEGGTG